MRHTLLITHHDNFLNDGSKINLCVKTITDGKMAGAWRGPILVLKLLGLLFKILITLKLLLAFIFGSHWKIKLCFNDPGHT